MQGSPAYARRTQPNYSPQDYASPRDYNQDCATAGYAPRYIPDEWAAVTPPVQQPSQPAPQYARPSGLRWENASNNGASPRGARYSQSTEVELDGDLGPLAGRYLRNGVVNGCTAWIHDQDSNNQLFWEQGPFGPCWTVAQGRDPQS